MNFEKLGGRKFFAVMGVLASVTALQWFGKIDPLGSQYTLIVLGVVGVYVTGNVSQKAVGLLFGK